jgi:hypothetical protein
MKLIDAYYLTLGKVFELYMEKNINVTIKTSRSAEIEKICEKYKDGCNKDILPSDKWVHVEFHGTDLNKVHYIKKELAKYGIRFDTGGSCDGGRDWELDWSFRLEDYDVSTSEMLDNVEDMIIDLGNGKEWKLI